MSAKKKRYTPPKVRSSVMVEAPVLLACSPPCNTMGLAFCCADVGGPAVCRADEADCP